MNADQKLLETEFLIAICRQSGDKWHKKNSVSNDFDLCSSLVLLCQIAPYTVCKGTAVSAGKPITGITMQSITQNMY